MQIDWVHFMPWSAATGGALIGVAEPEDRVCSQAHAGGQRDAHRLVDPSDLLDGDAQRHEVAAAAAPFLGEHEPEQSEFAHLVDDVDGEVVLAVPLGRVRGDLLRGEVAHDAAELLVVLGDLKRMPGS